MTAAIAKRPSARSRLSLADHQRLSLEEAVRAARHVPFRKIEFITSGRSAVAWLTCGHGISVGASGREAFDAFELRRLPCEQCAGHPS